MPLASDEHIATASALGRVARHDIVAPSDLPAFPRSTMDGFAVRAANTYGASEGVPAYLTLIGEVPMGRAPGLTVSLGQAALVHTGGMLPQGADAVVMVENTQWASATMIEVLRPVAPGENVIQIGDDVKRGELLVPSGHTLRPQDLGGLLALGLTTISVAPKPRVALIATGDELVPPDRPVLPGQVRDINTYTLSALIVQAGGVPLPLGIIADDRAALADAARKGLAQADMLVLSAGSSVSTRDLTAEVVAGLGKPGILVHGVAIRPGKPTILAIAGGKPVVGLPGNPVSAMVIFGLLVVPALRILAGCAAPAISPTLEAVLTRNIASTTGREDHIPVRLEQRDGAWYATPIFGESNLITTLIKAHGAALIPLDMHGLSEGQRVTVTLF